MDLIKGFDLFNYFIVIKKCVSTTPCQNQTLDDGDNVVSYAT